MFKRGVMIAEICLAIMAVVFAFNSMETLANGCVVAIAATLDKLVEPK